MSFHVEDEMKEVFKSKGFDIDKDLKTHGLKKRDVERLEKDLLSYFDSINTVEPIYSSSDHSLYFVKTRHKNEKANRGKSSGFRIISFGYNDNENDKSYFHILHLYSKSGSNRKDNLSQSEQNACRQILCLF